MLKHPASAKKAAGVSSSTVSLSESLELTPSQVVISIAVYYPRLQKVTPGLKMARFEFLGSDALTRLRDALHCPSDHITITPVGHTGSNEPPKYSPSFIFIGDTFYVDDRHEFRRDLSRYSVLIKPLH